MGTLASWELDPIQLLQMERQKESGSSSCLKVLWQEKWERTLEQPTYGYYISIIIVLKAQLEVIQI